jgi:O-antigen ligase
VDALPPHLHGLQRPLRLFLESDDLTDQLGPRADQLEIVLENWDQAPLLGIGPGLFKDVFEHGHEVHNTFGAVLIEHGSIGLVILLTLFSVLFIMLVLRASQSPDKDSKIILMAFAFSVSFLFIYCMASFGLRQRSFWITLGFALAVINLATQRCDGTRSRAPLWQEPSPFVK